MEKARSSSCTSIDPISHEVVKRFDAKKEDFQCTQFLGKFLDSLLSFCCTRVRATL